MRVHHISAATMCPIAGKYVIGYAGEPERGTMVCHCLVVESKTGLILIDAGLSAADLAAPIERLGRMFVTMADPVRDPEQCARARIQALGLDPDDVRDIVLTHLDLDHAGGLVDFPKARVHVMRAEHDEASHPSNHGSRMRYRTGQWAHGPEWHLYDPSDGESFFGFDCVRELDGLPPEIAILPLSGHSRGHAAIAVETHGRWLLHAGDAYFHHDEIHETPPRCPPGLRAFQRFVAYDNDARVRNQLRLRELARERHAEVQMFCAHSASEWRQLATPS